MKLFFVIASLLFVASLSLAFDAQHAFDVANELSSDKFEGRRSGFPGGAKAEQYIADYCKSLGLDAMGTDGYFQPVPMLVTQEMGTSFSVSNSELGKIAFVPGLDYDLVTHSGSRFVNKEVVVVGYGIVSEDKGRNDYANVDVRGKVVLIMRGEPKSAFSFAEEGRRTKTLAWAKERGAEAVIWYDREFPVNGAAIAKDSYTPDMPMIFVGNRVLQVLLENTGYSASSYIAKIKTEATPIETGKQISLTTTVKELKGKSGRNVAAMKFGTDPVLKNEIVVVGAHLDHCGPNSAKITFNGADDNASGSGLIAELANVVAQSPPLKRSVLFVWFTGEEDGLLGSKHFCEQPTVPFGNIVAMLNFDMVGQGDGGATLVGLELLGDVGEQWADSLAHSTKPPRIAAYDGEAASDYGPFVEAGAPAIAFWSSGSHPFYHQFTDDGKWLNVASFDAVGTQAEALIMNLGAIPGSLACRSDSLRMLSRYTTTLDLDGFFVDKDGTVKNSSSIEVAWLPHNSATHISDIVSSIARLHTFCAGKNIVSTGLKDAVTKQDELKQAVVLSIPEIGLQNRPLPEIVTLSKMGLSMVNLTPTSGASKLAMQDEMFKALKDAGTYALVPMDYNTSARVIRWGSKAIVTASLSQFANTPQEIRDSLLMSDALLLLEVDSTPTPEQLETIRAGRQRYVHLNFGESYSDMREGDQKNAFKVMYQAGFTRNDIIDMTGKNLRRFLNG